MLTSDVPCPIVIGTPLISVPILIPSVVSVVLTLIILPASISIPPALFNLIALTPPDCVEFK